MKGTDVRTSRGPDFRKSVLTRLLTSTRLKFGWIQQGLNFAAEVGPPTVCHQAKQEIR